MERRSLSAEGKARPAQIVRRSSAFAQGYSATSRPPLQTHGAHRRAALVIEKGQTNRENSSGPRSAINLDRAVVILDHLFRNVETKPGAAFTLLGGKIRIENLTQLLRINSRTRILNPNVDVEISHRAIDRHGPLFVDRSLDRIDYHVLNGPINLHRVTKKRARFLTNNGV